MEKKERRMTKGSIATIVTIAVLFLVAVWININSEKPKEVTPPGESAYNTPKDDSVQTSVMTGENYFAAYRADRESVRSKEIEYLDSIIADKNTDSETRKEAQEQKLTITECMETELVIETQLKAKGFSDVAVTYHNGAVSVVVATDGLSEAQAAQILETVMRESGESAENIRITPV